jgi:sugar phosphate isomerase/epimerase
MELAVVAGVFAPGDLETVLDEVVAHGFSLVELPTGNYGGTPCFDVNEVLQNPESLRRFRAALEHRGLRVCALSCQGNPLHPRDELAKAHHHVMVQTVRLAEQLGVEVVNVFSGCPGSHDTARVPHWSPCGWPSEFRAVEEWQWREKLIPYWNSFVAEAKRSGIRKFAMELHPGFMVYNTRTLLALRQEVGPEIGANFDPSHLFWQGIDPCVAIHEIGKQNAIFHFHAKDTFMNPVETARNGVFDTRPYDQIAERSWFFRMAGYGHSSEIWDRMFLELRAIGYDGAISIEHEDASFSKREGIVRAIEFLNRRIFHDPQPSSIWWGK